MPNAPHDGNRCRQIKTSFFSQYCLSRNLLLKQSRGAITSLWSLESYFFQLPRGHSFHILVKQMLLLPLQASNESELFHLSKRAEKDLLNAVSCVLCKFMSCLLLFIYFTPVRRYFFIRIFAFVILVV